MSSRRSITSTKNCPGPAKPRTIERKRSGCAIIGSRVPDLRFLLDVLLLPAGAANPRPGIIPAPLDFKSQREVPTMIVAGEADVTLPLQGVRDIYDRVPGRAKELVVLRGVDHIHFVDDAAGQHERVRAMDFPPELAYLKEEMRPFSELRNEQETHEIVKRLTAAHFDAAFKGAIAVRANSSESR